MTDTNNPTPALPPYVEKTIWSIAQLHAAHHQKTTPFQRAVNRVTALLAHVWFISLLTFFVTGWISLNLLAPTLGFRPLDPPPFPWLGGVITLVSFYMVILILTTQRHTDQLAERREQLTLELAILSEQKAAKVIQLLEEHRRDNPLLHDRMDHEAMAMAQPADPSSMLDAIKETHAKAEKSVRE